MAKCFNIGGPCRGWLVIFDSDYGKSWDEKISSETIDFDGKTIHIVRC